jgi:hypothetical protein
MLGILFLQVKIESQYFFYMEPQVALAIPDEDNCITIYSSTQLPESTQNVVAKCVGIPFHNVRVITRRVGGGFGGKALKSMHVSTNKLELMLKFLFLITNPLPTNIHNVIRLRQIVQRITINFLFVRLHVHVQLLH